MRYLLATDSQLTPPLVAEAALPGETLTVLVTVFVSVLITDTFLLALFVT